MVRTPSCDENGMKKGTWTPEEDRKLVAYVTRYGCWNWRQLPRFAGLNRCGKSCRLRWMNYLRPNLKRGNYSKEEEETIIRLHQSMGNKWSTIAGQLPGRTDNEVKNHWHTNLKKRETQQKDEYSLSDHPNDLSLESPDHHSQSQPNINIPQNVDTSTSNTRIVMSPQPSSISSEVDSATTTITTEPNNYLVAESSFSNFISNNNNNNRFDDFSEFNDDFWTEPFLADNSYIPTDTEFLSPEFDDNYLLFTDVNYWHQ